MADVPADLPAAVAEAIEATDFSGAVRADEGGATVVAVASGPRRPGPRRAEPSRHPLRHRQWHERLHRPRGDVLAADGILPCRPRPGRCSVATCHWSATT
jgi:hypothetical protein